jgi:membrane-bound inhibitor of C-type lysozyme
MLTHPILIYKVLGIVLILLAGCLNATTPDNSIHSQPAVEAQKAPKTFVYECSNTFSFVARIEDNTVWLFLPQKTLSLPRVPSGSGAKFSEGRILFWTKGDTALLENNDTSYRDCKNNRTKAIWEHAKLNGVDFRAVGNEPGWYLEIRNADQIVFISDYGTSRYEFVAPEPLTDQPKRTTIYKTDADGKNLTVVIEGRQCRDSMSGEYFETTVSVKLDQKKYQGCGRALH